MEILLFSAMSVLVFFTTQAAAVMTATMLSNAFLVSLVMVLPKAVLVGSIGFYLIDACLFRLKNVNNTDWMRIITLIVVLSVIGALLIVCIPRISWGSIGEGNASTVKAEVADAETDVDAQAETEEDADATVVDYAETETDVDAEEYEGSNLESEEEFSESGDWLTYQEWAEAHPWFVVHNLPLQSDGDSDNNANFGENRYHDDWTAMDYYRDFREVVVGGEFDPVIMVAAIATVDAARDTNLCGDYYDGNNQNWMRTLNAMLKACADDKVDALRLRDVFNSILKNEVRSVQIVYAEDINDQMYVDPYTYDGCPKIVVSETHQSGHLLVITFKRKGGQENDVSVALRVECLYQPAGVVELMHIDPEPVPVIPEHSSPEPTPTPKPGGKDPTPEPSDPTPEPSKDPTPTPAQKKKDKTKGTKVNTEPNDDPGPGPNTNNGVGSKTSTKDQPTNSNHMTEPEYKEEVKELKEINESQKTGNDPSTPSTTGPANTEVHVDSNADKGTGNGGIDTPTEKSDPAIVAETNQPISDSPGEAWEGPVD